VVELAHRVAREREPRRLGRARIAPVVAREEQQPSRVVYVGSRESEKQEVGIEFVKPSPLFWRIAFPPRDWTPLHEDAKGFAKRVPSQPKDLKKE